MLAPLRRGDTLGDSSISITAGTFFSTDIYISGIGGEEGGLIGGGVEFLFDPSQIQVNSLELDNSNWNLEGTLTFDNLSSSAKLIGGHLEPSLPQYGYSGTISLGSVEFTCMATGVSVITLSEYTRLPLFDRFVALDGTVFDQIITYNPTEMTQTPVPEPTTMLLFGTV